MKKYIAGVIVLFNPDTGQVLRNIDTYLPFIDKLFIIDNSGGSTNTVEKKLTDLPSVIYISNKSNQGIAAALNKGAAMASQNGYNWLLTMDQDSSFEEGQASLYFSFSEKEFFNKNDVALLSPVHFRESGTTTESYSDKISVMTSGNLIRLSAWEEVGGFDEKLFIDEVDHEYCYRLKKKGYKIIQLNNVFLNHQLGSQKEAGYLGSIAKRQRRIHSPARVYFMVRNYLYVRKKYKKEFPAEFHERDKALLVTLKNNLLFSGKFMANFKSVWKGWRDFKNDNFRNIV